MVKFFRKKTAMTLGEMMMVFVVIGVIASLAIVTIRPFEKSVKWIYYRTFHTINTAIYNAMLTKAEFPQNSVDFCKALLEYINSNDNNCAVERNVTLSTTSFTDDKIQIVASNGVRLYIAAKEDGKPFTHTQTQTNGIDTSINYYVVFADLNAEKKPNTPIWTERRMADIVGYVVTEGSDVVPIGYPEIDTRYMYAKVVYPPVDSDDLDDNVSESISYFDAKHKAWGTTVDSTEAMSFDFQADFPADSPFKITYPASYPSIDLDNGCMEENSPCYVKIEEYD